MKKAATLMTVPLIAIFFTLIISLPVFSDVFDENIDWQDASPSLIHQRLAQGKGQTVVDKKVAQQMLAQEALVNTQDNYDVTFYDISLRVNDTNEYIYGRVKFVATATQDNVSAVQVNLFLNLSLDSLVAPSGHLGLNPVSSTMFEVVLDHAYNTGEQFEFDVYYHGHPTEGGFQAFSFSSYSGVPVMSSLSEPYLAPTWWPCKDLMVDKADSFNIAVEVDTAFYVGSNGTLDSVRTASTNTHTYFYTVRYPMATYLFSVAISKYSVWEQDYVYNGDQDTMPVVYAPYPAWYNYSLTTWNATPGLIGIFADKYGEYPFVNEKYGHASFNWGGAMEHQTMTSTNYGTFGFSFDVVAHELSHQWWGDMITCASWEDIWLNEGWASYSEALVHYELSGWQAYIDYMDDMRYTGPGTIWVDDTTDIWRIFDGGLSYDKGAWVVHMLRGVLGDDLFFQAIDAYYHSQYQYGAATTEQFKNVWENATGVDLDYFFDEWIYGTYYPNYYVYDMLEPSDSGGYDLYVVIRQKQVTNPQVFTMPIDLVFSYLSGGQDTMVVFNDQRSQLFKFNIASPLTNLEFDPREWILRDYSFHGWEMFITSLDGELSNGIQGDFYEDTVETRGGSGEFNITITDGALPNGLSFDPHGVLSGIPTDTGTFTFTVHFAETVGSYYDDGTFTIHISPAGCCVGKRGDTNCDGGDEPDVSDIVRLIDNLYLSKDPLCCIEEADVNASGGAPDVSDIVRLIDYLYLSHDPLAMCP